MGRHSKLLENEPWHADYWNIVMVAGYLVQEKFYDADALLHFIEKPWHYDEEYKEAEKFFESEKAANKIDLGGSLGDIQ